MPPLIELRAVTKAFGGGLLNRGSRKIALNNLTLSIDNEPPSITALVGESGSGKTTLARLILGLTRPTEGEVRYRGTDFTRLNRSQRRQFTREVQAIFQDPFEVFNPFYKVDHSLWFPAQKFRIAPSRAEMRRRILETLEQVGLRPEETLGRYPHQLSGGQRQRVMIARALLLSPKVIVADEPVSMLDASLRATVLSGLQELRDRFGISVVYITHDLTTAYQIGEKIIVLYSGSVAEAGNVEQVIRDPRHPYTQRLIGAIPLPNPALPWRNSEHRASAVLDGLGDNLGCKYAPRCPHAMPGCVQSLPPLYQTDFERAAACFLYQEHTTIPASGLDELLRARTEPVQS